MSRSGAAIASVLLAASAGAQGTPDCFTGSPARPVLDSGPGGAQLFPRNAAGDIVLQPADPPGLALPSLRDSTGYTGSQRPSIANGLELFTAVDIETSGGTPYLYAAYNAGFQIWDLSDPTLASNAARLSQRDGFAGDFHHFEPDGTEFYFKVFGIDALDAPSHPGVLALASIEPVGLTLWDIDNKTEPVQIYQDQQRVSESVRLAEIDGRLYAFSARTSSTGIEVYDVSRAQEVGPCFEDVGGPCGGPSQPVHLGTLARPAGNTRTFYSDLLERQLDGQHYLAYSDGFVSNPLGVEVQRVDDPSDPTNADGDPFTNPILISFLGPVVAGVDLFEHLDRTYLATVHLVVADVYADVYDITDCLDAVPNACSAPTRVYRRQLAGPFQRAYVSAVLLSGTPMLYIGHHTLCSVPATEGGRAAEYLINLSGLPSAVASDGQELVVGDTYLETVGDEDREVNYWTSYYDGVSSGLSGFSPRRAAASGAYLYRAGWTILDVHQWTAPPSDGALFADGFESGTTGAWQ